MSEPEQSPQESPRESPHQLLQQPPPIPSPFASPTARAVKPPRAGKTARFECPYCHVRFGLTRQAYWKHFFLVRRPVLECPQCGKQSTRYLPAWAVVASVCAQLLAMLPPGFFAIWQAWNGTRTPANAVVIAALQAFVGLLVGTFFIRTLSLNYGVLIESEEKNP